MATAFDIRMANVALRLLEKYGTTALVTYSTVATYNPRTRDVNAATPATATIKITPPSTSKVWSGTTLLESEIRCWARNDQFMALVGPGAVVTIGTEAYKVTATRPVYSGDLIAVYEIVLQR